MAEDPLLSQGVRASENGYVELFDDKQADDELLNDEILDTLLKANVLIERWRREYTF